MKLIDTLITKVKRRVSRTKEPSFRSYVRDAAAITVQSAQGLLYLRSCNDVGVGARVTGQSPSIENAGRISIGSFLNLFCEIAPVAFSTGLNGSIEIGDSAFINFGTIISAQKSVKIGKRVLIGPYCVISDTEVSPGPSEISGGEAIEIGDQTWLAARVTVLPGSRIGAGSVIKAGSVVAGYIPPGVIAGGVPARVLKQLGPAQPARSKSEQSSESVSITSTTGLIVSDFDSQTLVRLLNESNSPQLGKFQALRIEQYDSASESISTASAVVLWTRPERAVPAFARLLAFEQVSESEILRQVDDFVQLVCRAAEVHRFTIVPTWVVPRSYRNFVVSANAVAKTLSAMNNRLYVALESKPNLRVLDAQGWLECGGRVALHPALEREHECPFHADVLRAACRELQTTFAQMSGTSRRLILLEPNGTLWEGSPTNPAWSSTTVDERDATGKAYGDFHRFLKAFAKRSVLVGIVSKSEEDSTLRTIENLKGNYLGISNLAGWRINWNDKSANIVELCGELSVPLNEVVFIEPDTVERSRIRKLLPDVLTPQWPSDAQRFSEALLELNCFADTDRRC